MQVFSVVKSAALDLPTFREGQYDFWIGGKLGSYRQVQEFRLKHSGNNKLVSGSSRRRPYSDAWVLNAQMTGKADDILGLPYHH